MAEVEERFVASAKDRAQAEHRALIWRAFTIWDTVAQQEFPGCRYWLSGSFLTQKAQPSDVDAILLLEESHVGPDGSLGTGAHPLWTLQQVYSGVPEVYIQRLQPVAGLVDGFLIPSWIDEHRAVWQRSWTMEYDKATRSPTGVRMGYLEVKP